MSRPPKGAGHTVLFQELSDTGASDHRSPTSKGSHMRFTDAEWRLWFRTLCALKAFTP